MQEYTYQNNPDPGSLFLKILALIILLAAACAKQGMPPGGPVDETPPQIISTTPAPQSTFVDRNIKVEVVFNEWINSRNIEEAVFISPYVGEDVKIKIGGKKITIVFPEPLKQNCTYVVTFGTEIKDLRNNAMEKSFTLAFSTGGVLDMGEMKGRVYEEDVQGTDVWAYSLNNDNVINPAVSEPDYIIQCEDDGDFHFTHIAAGKYRLFAVKDRIADRLYTRGEDRVGVTFGDVIIPEEKPQKADNVFFRMFIEDTLKPALVRAVPVNDHSVQLLFDQPVCFDRKMLQEKIRIYSYLDSMDVLNLKDAYVSPNDNKCMTILTEPQKEGKYFLKIEGVFDEAGNPVDPDFNTSEFDASTRRDTVKPELTSVLPAPGQKDINLNQNIHLVFSESMDTVTFNRGFSLADTLEGEISGNFKWYNPAEVSFIPENDFKSRTVYRVELTGEWIRDLSGNSLNDTLYQFKILNKDTLSGISGKIIDPDTVETGDMYVTLHQIENEQTSYQQKADSANNFDFRQILPGNYVISCFRDRDNNRKYSYGNPFPFLSAERFIVYSDTVLAKPRWPNSGNNITLPSYPYTRD